jgi:isopentenyl-diphosphate delta-isomerase
MNVILVDEHDNPVGIMEKMEAHRQALLHRAFSVFIFNGKGEMLLQKRAAEKYHSAGLWTNACCSHPMPGEGVQDAALRRLQEEMGFSTPLEKAFAFLYKAGFENGLTEHEYDHVFTGNYEGAIQPDPEEVSDHRFLSMDELREWVERSPNDFTAWFKIALPRLEAHLKKHP